MKQFKNTLAVAIAVAGLYGVPAMAGTAVHWAGSDAGGTKDVKWKVVQPSTLDFTVTPAQVTFVANDGGVNAPSSSGEPKAGTWRNDGDMVTVKSGTPLYNDLSVGLASGDAPRPQIERLAYSFVADSKYHVSSLLVRGDTPWPGHISGSIKGNIQYYRVDTGDWMPVPDISHVKSTRFTDTLTVTKYTV